MGSRGYGAAKASVKYDKNWKHLAKLNLADEDFGVPGEIDVLLGIDIFSKVIHQGQHTGPPGTPLVIETSFGWVLSGKIKSQCAKGEVVSCFSALSTGDDLLKMFCKVQNRDVETPEHFQSSYCRNDPPKRKGVKSPGKSKLAAV